MMKLFPELNHFLKPFNDPFKVSKDLLNKGRLNQLLKLVSLNIALPETVNLGGGNKRLSLIHI